MEAFIPATGLGLSKVCAGMACLKACRYQPSVSTRTFFGSWAEALELRSDSPEAAVPTWTFLL